MTRSAPSFAATTIPAASLGAHATIAGPASDLRATTTGTPSSPTSTPSASAEAAMSARSATRSAARPRRVSLSERAASKSSRVVASPEGSERMTAVVPAATAASMAAAVDSSAASAGATAKTKPGMRTRERFFAANRPPEEDASASSEPRPKSLPMADGGGIGAREGDGRRDAVAKRWEPTPARGDARDERRRATVQEVFDATGRAERRRATTEKRARVDAMGAMGDAETIAAGPSRGGREACRCDLSTYRATDNDGWHWRDGRAVDGKIF